MRILYSRRFQAGLLFLLLILSGGYIYENGPNPTLWRASVGPTNNLQVDTGSFALPNTDPIAQPDFDIFAWNTFIALNWPAVNPNTSNGHLRGIPNNKASFAQAKSNDLVVWETFKEKREIFNQEANGEATLFAWNHPVDYGPLKFARTDTFTQDPVIQAHPNGASVLHQTNKANEPFNALDETAEVGSEALEPFYPDGTTINPILGKPVGPRVWRGKPSDNNPVLYEVKLNYDYWLYILSNKLYISETFPSNQDKANNVDLRLPYRTSALYGPKGQTPKDSTYQIATKYSSAAATMKFNTINTQIQGGTANPATTAPPLAGAMQFKAAWIKLDSKKDDLSDFHWRIAYQYITEGNTIKAVPDTFGLIGLHIIQRVHLGSSTTTTPDPSGGTFVFATWEHTSIRNNIDADGFTEYTYSNYYNPVTDPLSKKNPDSSFVNPQGFYPPIDPAKAYDGVYRVKPTFNIIDQSIPGGPAGTKQVNEMVHSMLPNGSVWKNYQLVGTQFIAIDVNSSSLLADSGKKSRYPVSINDPQGIGLPVYLANLVIETNDGLQKFQGQPPGTLPIGNYGGVLDANPGGTFLRGNTNTSFNRVGYNMGGCMGCHGVAQSRGYSFSFVLLGGREGAKTDTETNFEIPPLDSVRASGRN